MLGILGRKVPFVGHGDLLIVDNNSRDSGVEDTRASLHAIFVAVARRCRMHLGSDCSSEQ